MYTNKFYNIQMLYWVEISVTMMMIVIVQKGIPIVLLGIVGVYHPRHPKMNVMVHNIYIVTSLFHI